MPAFPTDTCPYCEEEHEEHRVPIYLDEYEDVEYRPIDTIDVKGEVL